MYSHIFNEAFNIFSNIFNLKYIQKTRDIWVRCTFNFHTNVRRSNLLCFTDCTKDAAALIHRQKTLYWLFTQIKLSSIYRNNLLSLINVLDLDETRSVAYNLGETQTCNIKIFLNFSVARSSKACDKRRKTLKSWNAALSKYIQLAFCCTEEKLLIFYICEI